MKRDSEGRPLITRRTAEIAVRRLLRFVKGLDLSVSVGDDGKAIRAFVDTGRLGSARVILEQWRWEQENLAKRGANDGDGKLTEDQIRMLLASDPRLREMARDWDESRQ